MTTQTTTAALLTRGEARELLIGAAREAATALGLVDDSNSAEEVLATVVANPSIPELRAVLVRAVKNLTTGSASDPGSDWPTADHIRCVLRTTRQPMVCPDCGGPVTATLGWEGGSTYTSYQVVDGFECDDYHCGATWGVDGASTAGLY